jgi:hypothetical protein
MLNETDQNAPPSSPATPDLLTARALLSEYDDPSTPLVLNDVVAALRATLAEGGDPDYETMLTAQAFLMHMAFNRTMMYGMKKRSIDEESPNTALRAQRRVCGTLDALRKLRADKNPANEMITRRRINEKMDAGTTRRPRRAMPPYPALAVRDRPAHRRR